MSEPPFAALADELDPREVPPPTNPLAVSRQFITENNKHELGPTLAAHRGLFYRWAGTKWVEVDERDVRSKLYGWLEHAVYVKETRGGPELEPFAPNKYKIANIVDALSAAEHIASELDAPAWRGANAPWGADVAIAMENGVLARSTRTLHPHSPRFFNLHALDFAYDSHAPAPTQWLAFLRMLWGDDTETIRTLQEVMGYVLCGGTEQQKMFMFVGPKRSGKGTILRVLSTLLGREHVAAPTLSSLATNFGLQPLVGKPLAAISDARLGGRSDTLIAVERLLSISGEDTITVDRKYQEHWTGRLATRFVLLTNELPQFTDASGALASRFIILTFRTSFYGRENPRLTDELLTDAAGIFNWCLEGFDRLTERGHFEQPPASAAAVEHLEDLASPISAFLRDRCTIDPDATILKDEFWRAWGEWAEDAGVKKGSKEILIRDLRAAQPQIRSSRPTIDEKRVYVLTGLRLGNEPTTGTTPDTPDGETVVESGVSGVRDTVGSSRNGDVDEDELERLADLAREYEAQVVTGRPSPASVIEVPPTVGTLIERCTVDRFTAGIDTPLAPTPPLHRNTEEPTPIDRERI